MTTRDIGTIGESVSLQRKGLDKLWPAWDQVFRFSKRKPLGAMGGALLALLILVAIFANVLAPYDPYETNPTDYRYAKPAGPICWVETMLGATCSAGLSSALALPFMWA